MLNIKELVKLRTLLNGIELDEELEAIRLKIIDLIVLQKAWNKNSSIEESTADAGIINSDPIIDSHDCDRCGHNFKKDELTLHNNELLCFACEEEVIEENGQVSDV